MPNVAYVAGGKQVKIKGEIVQISAKGL